MTVYNSCNFARHPLWLTYCMQKYTCLLLLISMLWHRQAIFESKGDKLSSSAEFRIRTQGLTHQIASRLNARWQTDWAIVPMISEHSKFRDWIFSWIFLILNSKIYSTAYVLKQSIRHLGTSWRHQMEAFSALRALCAGNSPVPGEFPSQKPVTQSFDVFLICAWTNGWANNREAGDLRRHRSHYDVTVMVKLIVIAIHATYIAVQQAF